VDAIKTIVSIDVDNTKTTINELGYILHSGAWDFQKQIDEQIEWWYEEWLTSVSIIHIHHSWQDCERWING